MSRRDKAMEIATHYLGTCAENGAANLAGEIRDLLRAEREACAAKAREFAAHYDAGSDGRNTFILLAEWIEARASAR